MFLKLVAKDRQRSWTTFTWAIPLTVFASYGLYQRLVLGKERKPTPDLWTPFTPVSDAQQQVPVKPVPETQFPPNYVNPQRPFETESNNSNNK
ncbi:hypothetical protein HDU78_003054 [Chytriomyces hyalinus]|nr:hypothetical protein HDU78_003054 [Chytriomyces hyalinus]